MVGQTMGRISVNLDYEYFATFVLEVRMKKMNGLNRMK